jgi:hypothetical protein
MSVKLMSKAWDMDLPCGQKFVLLALCDHANDDGLCYPGQSRLADKCGMSPRTVSSHIDWLEKRGLIRKERRQNTQRRKSDLYHIRLDGYVHANSAHANSAHAEFSPEHANFAGSEHANFAGSYKEEPSETFNRQIEPSGYCTAPQTAADTPSCGFASEPAPDLDFADGISDGLVGNLPAETVKAETVQTVLPADAPKPAKPENQTAANRATWEAYRDAYRSRYGVEPLRNAKVNGQIAQFVRTVGAQDAPKLAAFYLAHNGGFFVQRRHDFGLLLQSAQQIRTDWLRGEQMTATAARQAEKTQANLESHKGALEILKNKGVI